MPKLRALIEGLPMLPPEVFFSALEKDAAGVKWDFEGVPVATVSGEKLEVLLERVYREALADSSSHRGVEACVRLKLLDVLVGGKQLKVFATALASDGSGAGVVILSRKNISKTDRDFLQQEAKAASMRVGPGARELELSPSLMMAMVLTKAVLDVPLW